MTKIKRKLVNIYNDLFLTSKKERGYIKKIDTISSDIVINWFQQKQKEYDNISSGILMRYAAVLKNRPLKKEFFREMSSNGYIQLFLDEQDREIRDSDGKIVYRYLEAKSESQELKDKFGNNDMIRFE